MKGIQCENFTKKIMYVSDAPDSRSAPHRGVCSGHIYPTGSCVLSYFGILSYFIY